MAIMSDDPKAIEKLTKKIDDASRLQDIMKGANRIVRSKPKDQITDAKVEKLVEVGIPAARAAELFTPDFCGRIGFASYELTNNNANIRRMKDRVEELKRAEGRETSTKTYSDYGFEVVENVEENRVQIIFDNIETYKFYKNRGLMLRQMGFKFSPTNGAWQRHLNPQGLASAQWAVEKMQAIAKPTEGGTPNDRRQTSEGVTAAG